MKSSRNYRDSYQLLRSLPEVFDLRDVKIALDMERIHAKTYCSRWVERGMAEPLGPRTGVFFNLVRTPKGNKTNIKAAVEKLIGPGRPTVAIGAFALHQHGWTTQRPQAVEIAILVGGAHRTVPSMYGVIAGLRKRDWFQAVMPSCTVGIDGFLTAAPEFALVDAIAAKGHSGVWSPDPSDIDLPSEVDPQSVMSDILKAAKDLGVDENMVIEFVSEIDGLDDIAPSP